MADIVYPGDDPGGTLGLAYLPANYDLAVYRGDFVPIEVTLKDNAGVAMNLTGYTAAASIKATYSSSSDYDFTAVITAATGKVNLTLPSTVSATILPGSYIWDFQIIDPAGNVRTLITGDVIVYDEVTK